MSKLTSILLCHSWSFISLVCANVKQKMNASVSKTQLNSYEGASSEKSYRLLAVNYFCKNLHLRFFTRFWMQMDACETIFKTNQTNIILINYKWNSGKQAKKETVFVNLMIVTKKSNDDDDDNNNNPRDQEILGWCPAGDSLISWGEISPLALVGNPSRDGVSIKILVWRHLKPNPQLLWVNYV